MRSENGAPGSREAEARGPRRTYLESMTTDLDRPPAGAALLRGAWAGAVATGAMSAVMFGAQRAGLMGRMPPHKITTAALRRLRPWTTPSAPTKALASVAHLGFGVAAGALYGLLRRGRGSVAGALGYATAVWAASYVGWVPSLGLMRPAHRDRPGRQPALLAAHLVYGAVLDLLARRRR